LQARCDSAKTIGQPLVLGWKPTKGRTPTTVDEEDFNRLRSRVIQDESIISPEDNPMTSAPASNLLRPRFRKSMTALAVAMTLAVVAPASHAGDVTKEGAVSIHFDREALGSHDSARDLYARIRTAARFACGDADVRELGKMQEINRCRADAVARAVEHVGSSTLGAIHREATGDDRTRVAAGA
jgi:UrcA family protein